jgi:hypothetical protein
MFAARVAPAFGLRIAGLRRDEPTRQPTLNTQHSTSNIQHPTSNIQRRMGRLKAGHRTLRRQGYAGQASNPEEHGTVSESRIKFQTKKPA